MRSESPDKTPSLPFSILFRDSSFFLTYSRCLTGVCPRTKTHLWLHPGRSGVLVALWVEIRPAFRLSPPDMDHPSHPRRQSETPRAGVRRPSSSASLVVYSGRGPFSTVSGVGVLLHSPMNLPRQRTRSFLREFQSLSPTGNVGRRVVGTYRPQLVHNFRPYSLCVEVTRFYVRRNGGVWRDSARRFVDGRRLLTLFIKTP